MSFSEEWHALIEQCEDLPEGATLITPLSGKRFDVTDVQEHRIVIEFQDSEDAEPLQREQFEALSTRVSETLYGFDLDDLPPDAEPYAAVLSLHPRYEIDGDEGIIVRTDESTTTQVLEGESTDEEPERSEPDVAVYSDALLLIDALERHDPTTIGDVETPALINLYTLLSDVQRDANELRQEVGSVLLDRMHHDQPVHGQFGSAQRVTRRRRTLKDDEEVLDVLHDAGIPRERVLGVDADKVDDALAVTELSESAVYEIDEREYVRKAEVDEEVKRTRLQGFKDRLATSEDPKVASLRGEIEELEDRIEELTGFDSAQQYYTQS